MSSIRRFFLWYGLLSKRLLRRPGYLAVLLLIPLFALALALFSRQESGVVTVALCLEEPADAAARTTAERLLNAESILRCSAYPDPEAAREAVRSGQADAAWILPADLEKRLDFFELGADALPEEALRGAYAGGFTAEELIRFTYVDGSEIEPDGRYLTAPLRGILALLLLLCGLASGMYCYREEREESFVWLSRPKRRLLPLLCHLTAMVPAALAVLAALYLSGLWLGLGREAVMMLLYLPCCVLFCEVLRCLSPREEHYGALIPILAVAVLVLCPVFVDLQLPLPFRALLPTSY